MVRSKPKKKTRGDDAFTTKKQKTGRKKLAPVTDTRAEVHARSLFISTSSAISKAQQQQSNDPSSAFQSVDLVLHRAAAQQSIKELLRGTTHYKDSHRSSSFASIARLLLQAQKARSKCQHADSGASGYIPLSGSPPGSKNRATEEEMLVDPMEKLRAFSAALEGMTDTDDASRRAALSVLQALFREEWIFPASASSNYTECTFMVNFFQSEAAGNRRSSSSALSKEGVWDIINTSQQKQAGTLHNKSGGPTPKSSSYAPLASILNSLYSTQSTHLWQQVEGWWSAEFGAVRWEDIERTDPTSLSTTSHTCHRASNSKNQVQGDSTRVAARKVALENIAMILHTIHICLTHAYHPVRWSGIELLESLLVMLHLQRHDPNAENREGADGLFRDACRRVCQKQRIIYRNEESTKEGTSNLSNSSRIASASHRELERLFIEEVWMVDLLRRVSELVLRTAHVPVLASLIDALLLSSHSSVLQESQLLDHPALLLAGLQKESDGQRESSPIPPALPALWSTTASRPAASVEEWHHAHLIDTVFTNVLLSPFQNAWQELMSKQLELLRQDALLSRAVALGRSVATVMSFLHVRCPSFTSPVPVVDEEAALFPSPFTAPASLPTAGDGSDLPRYIRPKNPAKVAQEQREKLLDVFVRRVPLTLEALLLAPEQNAERSSKLPSEPQKKRTALERKTNEERLGSSEESDYSREEEKENLATNAEAETKPGNGEVSEGMPSVTAGKRSRTSHHGFTCSSGQIRNRWALANALATVAAPLASQDEDAWKLLHQYFTLLFSGSLTTSENALPSTLEALASAMDVMLVVLRLHRSHPSVASSSSALLAAKHYNTPEEVERAKKKERQMRERLRNAEASRARVIHRTLLFAPAVFNRVLHAIRQMSTTSSSEGEGKEAAEQQEQSLSPAELALLTLISGSQQVLAQLSAACGQLYTYCEGETPPEWFTAASVGLSCELFRSLHRVWHLLPRFLFALRLRMTTAPSSGAAEGETSISEMSTAHEPSKAMKVSSPITPSKAAHGLLPKHSALIDIIVFSFLSNVWSMCRLGHFLLRWPSNEPKAVASFRSALQAVNRADGKGMALFAPPTLTIDHAEEASCGKEWKTSMTSLRGFIQASPTGAETLVHGVLCRCSRVTRQLTERIAFYLGDYSTNYRTLPILLEKACDNDTERKSTMNSDMARVTCHLVGIQSCREVLNPFVEMSGS